MSAVWGFLSRTQGRGRLSWTDWLSYAYLIFGFLIILVPVVWLGLNSVKSQFQIESQDLSLLPGDFDRVARATVNGPDGREISIIADLPLWVLNWSDLSEAEQEGRDVTAYLEGFEGNALYALRSHLGQVSNAARTLIAEERLPEWLNRYAALTPQAREAFDLDAVVEALDADQQRLLLEYLGVEPYQPNRIVTQVLVTAPHPDTGEVMEWAIPNPNAASEFLPGRAVNGDASQVVRLPAESVTANRTISPAWGNYSEPLTGTAYGVNVDFATCITNSVLVTVIATLMTLLINSMAAFALSKYTFKGQTLFLVVILATLMVPATITLVGVFKAINATGLSGSIWGVIIPGAATPAGVFLLRQYMLTIPDELLEAARMDSASEWKVYWRIVLPLALPAIAALGILSVIWRWNDLIIPMVAIATNTEAYTIQLCLLEFRGEHISQEHYRLAMTVVSLIPTTLVFVFLQKYITTGIANTGMK
ncbi:carbohydrate ABC transporter permease [Jannaschia sp. CCS1]|uniref:carbohydrate ABC transporter permease n=1 Tax=Jannaschia sp. (strain CCS1) TaxID=290400 RepID=UPI000053A7F1|nr:carbohydrate ABC transporter permease [Jannaschia sp. CCS1]ABD56859.1 carbohydrate ABC transporter membrane protein 2, CUT1 family [Jannaschia sp. CCS1]